MGECLKTNNAYKFLALLVFLFNSSCSEIRLKNTSPLIKTVRIKVASYCPENGRSLVNIFALNLSSQTASDKILLDTDRDGLSDNFEQITSIRDEYNLSYVSSDTNGDGYTDLFSYNIGYNTENQQALSVCDDPDQDTDRDLLVDCEEEIIGTDLQDPDTDKDGIPDGIEFRYSMNARDSLDSGLDHDGDGMNNLEEVMANSLIFTSYDAQILKHKVQYDVEAYLDQDNNQCYEVLVENIPLVDVNNGNKIQLFFLEMENVPGQEQLSYLRDVTVFSSRAFSDGYLIQIPTVENQTITKELGGDE